MRDTTPRHRRPNSKEFQAALRIVERYREAFAAHGILTATKAPSMGELCDLIAGVEYVPPAPPADGGIDDLIDFGDI